MAERPAAPPTRAERSCVAPAHGHRCTRAAARRGGLTHACTMPSSRAVRDRARAREAQSLSGAARALAPLRARFRIARSRRARRGVWLRAPRSAAHRRPARRPSSTQWIVHRPGGSEPNARLARVTCSVTCDGAAMCERHSAPRSSRASRGANVGLSSEVKGLAACGCACGACGAHRGRRAVARGERDSVTRMGRWHFKVERTLGDG